MNKPKKGESPALFSIDDFTAIQPLAKGWELTPGKFYLIVTPKQIDRDKLNALFGKMRDCGVEFDVHVGETPTKIAVMEKKDESPASAKPVEVAPGSPSNDDRSEDRPEGMEADDGPIQRPLGY